MRFLLISTCVAFLTIADLTAQKYDSYGGLEIALGFSYVDERTQFKVEYPLSSKTTLYGKVNFDNQKDSIITYDYLQFTVGARVYLSQIEFLHSGFYLQGGLGYLNYLDSVNDQEISVYSPFGVEWGFGYKFLIGNKFSVDLSYDIYNTRSKLNSESFSSTDAFVFARLGYNLGSVGRVSRIKL